MARAEPELAGEVEPFLDDAQLLGPAGRHPHQVALAGDASLTNPAGAQRSLTDPDARIMQAAERPLRCCFNGWRSWLRRARSHSQRS